MHKQKVAQENKQQKVEIKPEKKVHAVGSTITLKDLDNKLKQYTEEYRNILLKAEKKLDEINTQNTEILNIVSNKSTIVNHKIQNVNDNCFDIHNDLIDLMSHIKPNKMANYGKLKELYIECEHKYKNVLDI